MTATVWSLLILFFLAGCSTGVGSSIKQLSRDGKLEMGSRMELRVDFEEPFNYGKEPCPDRREIYDQSRGSSSAFDQNVTLQGALKF